VKPQFELGLGSIESPVTGTRGAKEFLLAATLCDAFA
jgi:hypothetical protein